MTLSSSRGKDTLPVLVVWMFLHVEGSQPLRLVDERPLLSLWQQLPLCAQPLRDFRVVHFGVLLGHFAALAARPHHKSVHRPFHPVGVFAVVDSTLGAAHPAGALDVVVVRRCRRIAIIGLLGHCRRWLWYHGRAGLVRVRRWVGLVAVWRVGGGVQRWWWMTGQRPKGGQSSAHRVRHWIPIISIFAAFHFIVHNHGVTVPRVVGITVISVPQSGVFAAVISVRRMAVVLEGIGAGWAALLNAAHRNFASCIRNLEIK